MIDSPRSIELEKSPRFRVRPAQSWTIRPDCEIEHSTPWSIYPASCITCMERTCHFKHCSCVIFTSNTDGIRGVSIVRILQLYVIITTPANIWLRFCKHWYMCKKYDNILLFIYDMGIWFSTGIYWLTLVIKHWKNRFCLKDLANRTRHFLIRMLCVFIII